MAGMPIPYKLPGTPSNLPSSENTCKRGEQNLCAQLQMDNKSALTYKNRKGFPSLSSLAKVMWIWCMDRKINLNIEYLPGYLSEHAG